MSVLYAYKVYFPNDSETVASWDKADGYDVKARLSADSYDKSHLLWQVTEGSDYPKLSSWPHLPQIRGSKMKL